MAAALSGTINVGDGQPEVGRKIWTGTFTGPASYVTGGVALVPNDIPSLTDPITSKVVSAPFASVDYVVLSGPTQTVGVAPASAAVAVWIPSTQKIKLLTTAFAEIAGAVDTSGSTFTISVAGK